MAEQELKEGRILVGYKESGNSMNPIIKHRQPVTLAPLGDHKLAVGDVVLAKVHGRRYLHKVCALNGDRVQIGNNKGHINGWTSVANVFGVVTHIDGVAR